MSKTKVEVPDALADISLSDVADAANDALARASQVADDAADFAREAAANAKPQIEAQIEALAETSRRRPLVVFAVGAVAGIAVAAILLSRRRKRHDSEE